MNTFGEPAGEEAMYLVRPAGNKRPAEFHQRLSFGGVFRHNFDPELLERSCGQEVFWTMKKGRDRELVAGQQKLDDFECDDSPAALRWVG